MNNKPPAETFEYRIGYEYVDETPTIPYPTLLATVEVMAVARGGGWGAPRATRKYSHSVLGPQRLDEFQATVRHEAERMQKRVAEAWAVVGNSPELSYK